MRCAGRDGARQLAPVLVELVLGDGEVVAATGASRAGSRPAPPASRRSAIGIEADAVADPAGGAPTVAERQRRRAFGVAGQDPDRRLDGAAAGAKRARRRRSPSASVAAVAGPRWSALSQVSFVNGRGSSCSQPLLAKRPSPTDGSATKTRGELAARRRRGAAGAGDVARSAAHSGSAGAAARRRRCAGSSRQNALEVAASPQRRSPASGAARSA